MWYFFLVWNDYEEKQAGTKIPRLPPDYTTVNFLGILRTPMSSSVE